MSHTAELTEQLRWAVSNPKQETNSVKIKRLCTGLICPSRYTAWDFGPLGHNKLITYL